MGKNTRFFTHFFDINCNHGKIIRHNLRDKIMDKNTLTFDRFAIMGKYLHNFTPKFRNHAQPPSTLVGWPTRPSLNYINTHFHGTQRKLGVLSVILPLLVILLQLILLPSPTMTFPTPIYDYL